MSHSKGDDEINKAFRESLLKALENETNSSVVNLDYGQIAKTKNDILQKLPITVTQLKKLHTQLKMYRYVETMDELNYGRYIRWIRINVEDPSDLTLTVGGHVCDLKVVDDEIRVFCLSRSKRIFHIKMNEVLMFQKLSPQEDIILTATKAYFQ
jgi:hypothetical protein